MALDKNRTGIMAAISAATEGKSPDKAQQARAHRTLPRGTVGSVRAGLGGIQDVPTEKILAWGPQDRLELTAVNSDGDDDVSALIESIKTAGQQVPVLLRPAPHPAPDGMFEVIYGRRRIHACHELGIPVKALIRTLDDGEALMAKGLENASRQDLSFYERARFAQAILDQGYSREEVQQALSISKNTLSQLERVSRLIPDEVGLKIGAAHGAGRPKWMALAAGFDVGSITEGAALNALAALSKDKTSDQRLERLLAQVNGHARGARQARKSERSPMDGAMVKTTKSSVTVTVKRSGDTQKFAEWFDANIDRLITESFETFQKEGEG